MTQVGYFVFGDVHSDGQLQIVGGERLTRLLCKLMLRKALDIGNRELEQITDWAHDVNC